MLIAQAIDAPLNPITQAAQLLASGHPEAALPLLDKAVGLQGTDVPHILYLMEECNRLTQRVQEAREAFIRLNREFPDSAWTHLLLGNALESQDKPEQAIAEYKLALAADAAVPNTNFAIGYIYWRQQDFRYARAYLTAETKRSCHSLAYQYLGEIARSEGNLASAEHAHRQAIQCDSTAGAPHLRLGIVLDEQHRYPEAITELKLAARLLPDDAAPHYRLGTVYREMGRRADAEAEFALVRQKQSEAQVK